MKPKILIVTCMYQRPVISAAFCEQVRRLQAYHSDWLEIDMVAGVSEDESAQVCADYGFRFNWFDNFPLSDKWNSTLDFAVHDENYDFVCIMGDDDFMHNQLFISYIPHIMNKTPHFGVDQMYAYSLETGEAVHFRYDKPGRLIGAGRMISKDLIESTKGPETYRLWGPRIDRGLDTSLEKICAVRVNPVVVEGPVHITDVKSATNLWPFEKFKNIGIGAPKEDALANLSEREKSLLLISS